MMVTGRGLGSQESPWLAHLLPSLLGKVPPPPHPWPQDQACGQALHPPWPTAALAASPAARLPLRAREVSSVYTVLWCLLPGWGWVGLEGPTPHACVPARLCPRPGALLLWTHGPPLLSASPILAGPPKGDLGRKGGCREPRPGGAGGSGCGWKLCHKDLGAVRRCSESPGEKGGGSGLPRTVGNWPLFPCSSSTSQTLLWSQGKQGEEGGGGAGSSPRIHRGN